MRQWERPKRKESWISVGTYHNSYQHNVEFLFRIFEME